MALAREPTIGCITVDLITDGFGWIGQIFGMARSVGDRI
jgi:hypothetical protein